MDQLSITGWEIGRLNLQQVKPCESIHSPLAMFINGTLQMACVAITYHTQNLSFSLNSYIYLLSSDDSSSA